MYITQIQDNCQMPIIIIIQFLLEKKEVFYQNLTQDHLT